LGAGHGPSFAALIAQGIKRSGGFLDLRTRRRRKVRGADNATYPALESSPHAAFLIAGEEKRAIFARFQRGDNDLPAARLRPTGTLWLFADAAATPEPRPK
jgi:hypothetical protein